MEGPSLVILKEELKFLSGKTITEVYGNSKIDKDRMAGEKIIEINSFGKHFLIGFKGFFLRIHFLMFGSYRLNEQKDLAVRLGFRSKETELNFYSSAVSLVEGSTTDHYDWSIDVMSDQWDPVQARKKLKRLPNMNVGDALLDQTLFAGVGNIIKNEVLYRLQIHPENTIGSLPPRKLTALVAEARQYSFDFYHWKKLYVLRKHWLIYKQRICRRCELPVSTAYTGVTPRKTYFCTNCQLDYNN